MRKLMVLSAGVLALSMSPALADGHGNHDGERASKAMKHDTNGDGVISKGEFMDHAQKRAEERFEKMDADGDGSITRGEAKAGRKAMHEERKEKMSERKEKYKERKESKGE